MRYQLRGECRGKWAFFFDLSCVVASLSARPSLIKLTDRADKRGASFRFASTHLAHLQAEYAQRLAAICINNPLAREAGSSKFGTSAVRLR